MIDVVENVARVLELPDDTIQSVTCVISKGLDVEVASEAIIKLIVFVSKQANASNGEIVKVSCHLMPSAINGKISKEIVLQLVSAIAQNAEIPNDFVINN